MKTETKAKQVIGIVFMVLSFLALSSCTKEIPYKLLPSAQKEQDVEKKFFDEQAEFLYSSSQQNSSMSAESGFPFISSENKRVKLQMTKNSLRIVEIERDNRFAANDANNKLVLEIPVEHLQYDCAKDRYGECTNTEVANDNIPWMNRNIVKIKFDEMKSAELELLPILDSATIGENCFENVSSRIKKADVNAEAINFQIERTFKTNLNCLGDIKSLADATVTAVYHYSLVRADKILSKDFKTISYPVGSTDEQTFGFFSTVRTILDVDNNNTSTSQKQIMNHWNPNREEIVYHLSDEFDKPENKLIKDLTYLTVGNLNRGLEAAGLKFKINLKDPSGKIPGDIRNSMIVLVEDPVATSVIGYGPQTEDPVTGEIVSARTVMFLGTIKKFVKYTYDEIIREKRQQAQSVKAVSTLKLSDSLINQVQALKKNSKVFDAIALKQPHAIGIGNPVVATNPASSIASTAKVSQIKKHLKNYVAVKNLQLSGGDTAAAKLKAKMQYLHHAKNCAFAPSVEGVSGKVSKQLLSQFPADAKPWDQLSNTEKDAAIALILPQIWIPTLIHELGHNLGLRHNFAASEDKKNFLSEDELVQEKVDHLIPFSSVMDYGNDLKALPVLGKYDIAALKFAYLRQVEVIGKDGATKKLAIADTLESMKADLSKSEQTLKEYMFCTDEHVGINAGCKRFDLGTTYTEIVQNLISDYENAYSNRNLRAGRANMSLVDDLTYANRINQIFEELRIMLEVKERIKYRFNLVDTAPEWESIEFLADLKGAAFIGGNFLARVVLVPDATCAVALAEKPLEVIAVERLEVLSPEAISCFKIELNPKYVVVAQGGKLFNSKKDPESTNAYADQIDVRGIWLDKVQAIRNLVNREIGIPSMDENSDSFLNVSELRGGILGMVDGLTNNNVVDVVPFTLADGSTVAFEIGYDLGQSQVIKKPLLLSMVRPSVVGIVANLLGVNAAGTTPLQQTILKTVATEALDATRTHEDDKAIAEKYSVYKTNRINDSNTGKDVLKKIVGSDVFMATSANTLAIETLQNLAVSEALEKLAFEKIEEILKAKIASEAMSEAATDDEKAVWALSAETIDAYVAGIIKPTVFYTQLLQAMPLAR